MKRVPFLPRRRWLPTVVILAVTGVALAAAPDRPSFSPEEAMHKILDAGPKSTFAWEWLRGLCDGIGPRLSGSDAMDRAIEYAVKTLGDAGFDQVRTEPVMVPAWTRGEEGAWMIAPVSVRLPMLGLGRSVGTPEGGIEADVMVVRDFDELAARGDEAKGKIVLYDEAWEGYGKTVEYRWRGAVEAARHGAVAALIRSVTGVSLATPHTGVMGYDDEVAKIPSAAITVEDAGRIHRLVDAGEKVRIRLVMGARTLPDRRQANVVAEITGREKPDEIVLVSGHLDSWDVGTGAHDDGAGCAIAVGAAQLIKYLGLQPRRTIRVVLYQSEEYGGDGGRAYLESHAGELDRHVAAIESDSGCFAPAGFSARADDAVIARLQTYAEPLADLGAADVKKGWAGVDIDPIVEKGVPGLAVRTHNDLYFNYHHSPADTLDKIDPADLAANVTATAALVYAIADDPVSLRDTASAQR